MGVALRDGKGLVAKHIKLHDSEARVALGSGVPQGVHDADVLADVKLKVVVEAAVGELLVKLRCQQLACLGV